MNPSQVHRLIQIFNQLFADTERTLLVSGGSEPYYHPPTGDALGSIVFRDDYVSSALHEIAHWCIAGHKRRQLADFGYWYEPDGRTPAQQAVFEQVEIKPQALEWALSLAAGVRFNFSADNLSSGATISPAFQREVWLQCVHYLEHGLPARAQVLFDSLHAELTPELTISLPSPPC